jgi:hypothetical protein
MAGDEGEVDYVCDDCGTHHYHCCRCGDETLGAAGEEMCERCFRDLVEMDGVVRSLRSVLSEDALATALSALKRDYPHRFKNQ